MLRSITDEIMYSLMALSGQEYVDLYAADVKKAMDAEKMSADEVVSEMLRAQALKRPAAAPVSAPGGRPVPDVEVPEPPDETEGGASHASDDEPRDPTEGGQ